MSDNIGSENQAIMPVPINDEMGVTEKVPKPEETLKPDDGLKPEETLETDETLQLDHVTRIEKVDNDDGIETSKSVNITEDLYYKDGGMEGHWLPAARVYTEVNGNCINKPDAKAAARLACPGTESVDTLLTAHCPPHDFASIQIKLYGRNHKIDDENIGHLLIWMVNVVSAELITVDEDRRLTLIRRFSASAKSAPNKLCVVRIITTQLDLAIPHGIARQFRRLATGGQVVKQIETLQQAVSTPRDDGTSIAEFLVPVPTEKDHVFLTRFISLINAISKNDRNEDPLKTWFEHSPNAHVLTIGQCPVPGSSEFPSHDNKRTRVFRYAAPHQQLVAQVLGSVFDAQLEAGQIQASESASVNCHVVPLEHVEGNRRFLCVVDPGGSEAVLPRNGERCKMNFPEAKVQPTTAQIDLVIHNLVEIVMSVQSAPEFAARFNREASTLLHRPLTTEEAPQLTPTQAEKSATDDDVGWTARLSEWFHVRKDILNVKGLHQDQEGEDLSIWWTAHRIDLASMYLKPHLQVYMVSKPLDKGVDDVSPDELPPLLDIEIAQVPGPEDKERGDAYFHRILDPSTSQLVRIMRVYSEKTIKAENFAINSLIHPPHNNLDPPSEQSLAAYKYLIAFAKTTTKINVLEDLPGLANIIAGDGPVRLQKWFDSMNDAAKDVFRGLGRVPARVHMVPGCAGSGKSRAMEIMALFAQFGHLPHDANLKTAESSGATVLYLMNLNSAVDVTTGRMTEIYGEFGIENAPQVVRLYAMESEVKAATSALEEKMRYPKFDREAAKSMDFDDHFLAQAALNELSIEVHDAHATQRSAKRGKKEQSLHAAVFERFQKLPPEETADINSYIEASRNGRALSIDDKARFKALTKAQYGGFLDNFKGTIVTTPVAAAESSFRFRFSPDIVIMDEAGIMRELTTLIGIAHFSPKVWVLTGDPVQKHPHITLQNDLGKGSVTNNPFANQITLSTIARAAGAGATSTYLTWNLRAWGNSMEIGNELCYHKMMKDQGGWNDDVRAIIQHFTGTINPMHSDDQCFMLVEFPGAHASKQGVSTINEAHERWILRQLVLIVTSPLKGLGKNANKPANVLVVPMYKAQNIRIQVGIKKLLVTGTITEEQSRRIKVKTLDEAQGDEADIVLGDFVSTSHPGFTAEPFRIALITTRARAFTIILLNRGTFVGYESEHVRSRANLLYRLHSQLMRRMAVVRIPCCRNCNTDEHTTEQCTAEQSRASLAGVVCGRDRCPEKQGHHSDFCPFTTCSNCDEAGHHANQCEKPLHCRKCDALDGHLSFNCPKAGSRTRDKTCRLCNEQGHFAFNCPGKPDEFKPKSQWACMNCNSLDHKMADCPKPRVYQPVNCNTCGEHGHKSATCSKRTCKRCNEAGHLADTCMALWCELCRVSGDHWTRACPIKASRKVEKCANCRGPHISDKCLKDQFTGKDNGSSEKKSQNRTLELRVAPNLDWATQMPDNVEVNKDVAAIRALGFGYDLDESAPPDSPEDGTGHDSWHAAPPGDTGDGSWSGPQLDGTGDDSWTSPPPVTPETREQFGW